MKLDLGNLIATYATVNARTVSNANTNAVNGTGLDRLGYESAVLFFNVGAVAGSPTGFTVTCSVEDSSDNITYTAISSVSSVLITTTNTIKEVSVNLETVDRYIRGVMTTGIVGGTAPVIAISSSAILGAAKKMPV